MSQSQSFVRVWWRTAIVFVVVVFSVNVLISFIHSKLYPSSRYCVRTSHVPLYIQQESIDILGDPRQLYLHVDTPLLPLTDKDIVVRSAYANHHKQNLGHHKNSTIILIEVRKSLLVEGVFKSCGVGRHSSSKLKVVSLGTESGTMNNAFPHTQALLHCYDVTANHRDHAWVAYKKTVFGGEYIFRANAEQPVLYRRGGRDRRGNIVVCAAMLPHYTPFVEDWIRYQETIGVDHVHLTLDSSFLREGRFDEDFLQTAVEESYLSVEFWHQWLNETDISDHSLDLALYSCALRYQDTYSYIVFSDPRDFFVPRDPTLQHRLPEFLSQWCPATHCQFEWRNLLYDHCEKAGSSGNVTAALLPKAANGFSKRDQLFTVYKANLMVHRSDDKGLSVLDSSGGTVVPVERGYFVHLGRQTESFNARILPENERC